MSTTRAIQLPPAAILLHLKNKVDVSSALTFTLHLAACGHALHSATPHKMLHICSHLL